MKSKKMRQVLSFILTMALCLQMGIIADTSCSQAAKKTKLSSKKLTMTVGQKKKVKIKNRRKAAKYSFKSSRKKVASVSKTGKVTAIKKGTAVITVKEKYKKKVKTVGKVKVTVKSKKPTVTGQPVVTQTPAVTSVPVKTNTPGPTAPGVTNTPEPTNTPGPTNTGEPGNTAGPTESPVIEPTTEPEEYIIDQDFEDGDRGNFTQMGNVTLDIVEDGHDSSKCLKVSGRTDTWNGTDYNLADLIVTEQEYSVSAWVKHDLDENTAINITLVYAPADGGDNNYVTVGTVSAPGGEWVNISGKFTVPEGAAGYKIYFELADKTADFYVDDVLMSGQKAEISEPDLDAFVNTYYDSAVEKSFVSTGNSYRMNKVIEKAQAGKDVYLAFIGGSITEGADLSSNSDCYANQTYLQFKEKYGAGDGSNVHYVNAGMSGTPSALGSIRYERDVVQALGGIEPDLVFVEFAVNDGGNQDLNFRTYESFVRSLLKKDNAPAVMLIFSVFDTGFNLQSYYAPVGEAYSLPMVSIKNGITGEIAAGHISNKQFFNMTSSTPGLHPNKFGAKFMADCIMNTIDKTNAQPSETDADFPSKVVFEALADKDSIQGDSFEGIQMIDPNTIPDEVVLDAGDFNSTDTNVGNFLFNSKPKFPTNWKHVSSAGSQSFKMKVTCRNMLLAYKLSSSKTAGEADIYVDGEKVVTLNGYSSSGWNNAETALIFNDSQVSEHEIEIKMADGNEAKEFTILTLGYTK